MKILVKENKVVIENEQGKEVGHVLFPNISNDVVDIKETFVDDSLRGQGAAGKMMLAAYDAIKSSHLKAKLTCSYAISWFDNHPSYKDIVIS